MKNAFKIILFFTFWSLSFTLSQHEDVNSIISHHNIKLDKTFSVQSLSSYSNNIDILKLDPIGFIILSKKFNTTDILGFSFTNNINLNLLPENLNFILERYQSELSTESNIILNNHYSSSRDVSPLISAEWDQGAPYNGMCPTGPPGTNLGTAVVGCVAVGMAQVIHYFAYPPTGIGSVLYNDSDYGDIYANFEDAHYDYEDMPDNYGNEEVQELLFHCGVAVEMDYGPDGSGAAGGPFTPLDYPSAFSALQEHFGYQENMQFLEKIEFSDDEWIDIIKNELDNNRPVIYDACANVGCHTWNIDGYQGDYLHCNWGWGGYGNGYFLMDNLNPEPGVNFNDDTWAIVGIEPGNILLYGDINLDGNINIQDIILTINIVLGNSDFNQAADMNQDNIIDILDIVLIINLILEID